MQPERDEKNATQATATDNPVSRPRPPRKKGGRGRHRISHRTQINSELPMTLPSRMPHAPQLASTEIQPASPPSNTVHPGKPSSSPHESLLGDDPSLSGQTNALVSCIIARMVGVVSRLLTGPELASAPREHLDELLLEEAIAAVTSDGQLFHLASRENQQRLPHSVTQPCRDGEAQ